MKDGSIFRELANWSLNLWSDSDITPKDIQLYALQGFEQKGYGHITQILDNISRLLEVYKNDSVLDPSKKTFISILEGNIQLCFLATHLHDIGMRYPGIFEHLSPLVSKDNPIPLHIGELVHRYHHYVSFIILMEIGKKADNSNIPWNEHSYIKNLLKKEDNNCDSLPDSIIQLDKLLEILKNIHNKHFNKLTLVDFISLLALLCLYHKEFKQEALDPKQAHYALSFPN
ncbi:MAG: hypothetical protein KJ927_16695, partial [Candidatus Eisenbacteria bacterium]|nr:hypothetical protein [Candidatus Eisenbacteria bacterium]